MTNNCCSDDSEQIKEALTVLGDRWSALIVQLLHEKPYRFCEIEKQLGIGTRTLTDRLDRLADKQILSKVPVDRTNYHMYELTDKGRGLDSVIHAMAEWSTQYS